MLRFNRARRTVLSDTLRELANLVVAALVLGQFAGGRRSLLLIFGGMTAWVLLVGAALVCAPEGQQMADALIMVYGIILVAWIVVLLDWWGRRKARQSNEHR